MSSSSSSSSIMNGTTVLETATTSVLLQLTTTSPFLPSTTDDTNFSYIIDPKCRVYYLNNTGILIKDYEGIPENLIVNVAAWFALLFVSYINKLIRLILRRITFFRFALLVLFTFLRRIGDYGRFGLLKNDEERFVVVVVVVVVLVHLVCLFI
jgi:hypothetical protein